MYKFLKLINPNYAIDSMLVFIKKVSDDSLVLFTKDGIGEILNLEDGKTIQELSSKVGRDIITFEDIYLHRIDGELKLIGIYGDKSYIYDLSQLKKGIPKLPITGSLEELDRESIFLASDQIVASCDQIQRKKIPRLQDNMFDITSIFDGARSKLIGNLSGGDRKYLKGIYCYHKIGGNILYCGHECSRISVWELV